MNKFHLGIVVIAIFFYSCGNKNVHSTTVRKVNIEPRVTEHHSVVEHDDMIVSKEIDIVQLPDDSKINVIILKTKIGNFKESLDGYTILVNEEEYYEYAVKDKNEQLILSGVRAHNLNRRFNRELNFLKKHEKHLR